VDIRKVKKLIELLETSSVDEIEIHEGEGSVRVTRHRDPPAAPVHHYHAAPAAAPPAAMHPPAGGLAPGVSAEPGAETEGQLPPGYVVISPMVGMFYQASSPGSKPFVTIGQRVAPGDTLCIIEAMKILNQIESEVAGEVKAIIAENGHPVEYGEPLFVIDTDV
jgi:acetyl-CoA carboxylase biotin carboxyl carrier protein